MSELQMIGDDNEAVAIDSKQMEQLNLNEMENDGDSESVAETSGTNASSESSGNNSLKVHKISPYDPSIELVSEISDSFQMEGLDGLFERCDNEDDESSSLGTIIAQIKKKTEIYDKDNKTIIEGPQIYIECTVKDLPKRKVKRDFEIGIIQFSKRSLKLSNDNIEYYYELFTYLLHDQEYVLDRVLYEDIKEDSRVHPFYSKESFHTIKEGTVPEEQIFILSYDNPASEFPANSKWEQFERCQRFPVFVIINDGVEFDYRVLYSFEWVLDVRVNEVHRKFDKNIYGIKKVSLNNNFNSMRSAFDYPVCNYGDIAYMFCTKSKEVTVFYPKNLNGFTEDVFEAKIRSKLMQRHPKIKDISFIKN